MYYILINVHCDEPFREILMAEMGLLDFDSFVETEVGFEAYIGEETFDHRLCRSYSTIIVSKHESGMN
jgi:ribosomal protein L11 methyltransferase